MKQISQLQGQTSASWYMPCMMTNQGNRRPASVDSTLNSPTDAAVIFVKRVLPKQTACNQCGICGNSRLKSPAGPLLLLSTSRLSVLQK